MRSNRELAIITCYFNPKGYSTKRENFARFAESMKSQGSLTVIECAFGSNQFDLFPALVTKKVRASAILWQKERLINIVLSELPPHIEKFAWIDCDLIFENQDWVADTIEALDTFAVVQPFDAAIRLPQGAVRNLGTGQPYNGFGAVFNQRRVYTEGLNSRRHGHTGFAWAARRSALPHGLYDRCISGNGDHLMSHGFTGDWKTECFRSDFADNPRYRDHFESWSVSTYPHICSKVGYVPGHVLHLWHGDDTERRYMDRNRDLNALCFDPATDLRVGQNECLEWNTDKPELHSWARSYFTWRNEDETGRNGDFADAMPGPPE